MKLEFTDAQIKAISWPDDQPLAGSPFWRFLGRNITITSLEVALVRFFGTKDFKSLITPEQGQKLKVCFDHFQFCQRKRPNWIDAARISK